MDFLTRTATAAFAKVSGKKTGSRETVRDPNAELLAQQVSPVTCPSSQTTHVDGLQPTMSAEVIDFVNEWAGDAGSANHLLGAGSLTSKQKKKVKKTLDSAILATANGIIVADRELS